MQSQDGKDHNDQLDVTPGKFCCASPLSHFTPCTDFGSPVQADVDTPGTTVASPIDMEDATIYTNRLFGVGGSGDERNGEYCGLQFVIQTHGLWNILFLALILIFVPRLSQAVHYLILIVGCDTQIKGYSRRSC